MESDDTPPTRDTGHEVQVLILRETVHLGGRYEEREGEGVVSLRNGGRDTQISARNLRIDRMAHGSVPLPPEVAPGRLGSGAVGDRRVPTLFRPWKVGATGSVK